MGQVVIKSESKQLQTLSRYCLLLVIIWAIVISTSAVSSRLKYKNHAKKTGYSIAIANLNKDQSIRSWSAMHGDVYVPIDEQTQPNPYLSHLPDRDITYNNKKLTLMNADYLMRQFNEIFGEEYGIFARMTSLTPLRPENGPDAWERQALESFEQGVAEVIEFTTINGKPFLRLIRPMLVMKECLKCHGDQGYMVGDVLGGFDVTVPMESLYAQASDVTRTMMLWHTLILCFGLGCIGLAFFQLKRQIIAKEEQVEKVEKEHELFIAIMSATDAIVSVADMESYELLFLNKCGEKIYGNSLLGKPCWQVLHQGRTGPCKSYSNDKLLDSEGKPNKTPHVFESRNDFTNRWYQCRAQAISWVDGRLVRLVVATDITERREQEQFKLENTRQEEELKRFESLKTMAGAIAHRFNNSMTAVIGNLQFAGMGLTDGVTKLEMVSDALQAAREASQVGSLMLTYVGQTSYRPKRSSLSDLVEESVTKLKSKLPTSISLKFTPPSEPLYCLMDHQQIKDVMNSVIINATESLENTAGTIEITFGTENYQATSFPLSFQNDNPVDRRYVFCQIRDSGSGINTEDLERIFEPFYSTKFVGRGLGLALTVGIMRSHQGALTVESISGQGTTFRILLPVIA